MWSRVRTVISGGKMGGSWVVSGPAPLQAQLTVSKDGSFSISPPAPPHPTTTTTTFFLPSDFDTPPNKDKCLCPLPVNQGRPGLQWK